MPAKKTGVVRTRYIDPVTNTPKFLQTSIAKHANRDAAKKFLDEKKRKILEKANKEVFTDVTNVDEDIDTSGTEPDSMVVGLADNEQGECNLMSISVESSPIINQIYDNLQFSPFKLDMDITKTGYSVTIFGSSKSGKTYLLEHLLKRYVTNKKSICILAAQNIHNNIYKDYPKDIIKTDAYSPLMVKAGARINKKLNNKFPICYVLDDIITMKNDKKLEDAYLTLRNSLISIIVLIQNIQLLKSTSRSNSNILIFKKFNNPLAIENYVMKEYLANYPPFRDLDKMSMKVSLYMKIMNDGNYNFFVLDVLENTLILCKGTDLKKS